MGDPLTALIHAVQVMNFLKTLINKTLRDREESGGKVRLLSSVTEDSVGHSKQDKDGDIKESGNNYLRSASAGASASASARGVERERAECSEDVGEKHWGFRRGRRRRRRRLRRSKDDGDGRKECCEGLKERLSPPPVVRRRQTLGSRFIDGYESEEEAVEVEERMIMEKRRNVRKGMRKHPVFQLSRAGKKIENQNQNQN